MKLIDIYSETEYTITDIFKEWKEFLKTDSVNHSESFMIEFYEILMATINGRNDYEITGLTAKETSNLILSIRSAIERKGLLQ